MQEETKEEVQPEATKEAAAESQETMHADVNEQAQTEKDDESNLNQNNEENSEAAKEIEELKAQLDEKENRYLRLLADFDNFRRRSKIEKEADEKYRAQHLITNLLPAIDNFERAMQIEPDNEQTKALLEGMEMVYRNIIEALKSEGAEQIEAVGQEFDPNLHQAVMQSEEEGTSENIVLDEFQKGYILKDRVIRPSMVKVSK